jgi:hypothetical protein
MIDRERNFWGLTVSALTLSVALSCQTAPTTNTSTANTTPASTPAANVSAANTSGVSMSAEKQRKMKERAAAIEARMQQNPCSVHIWEDENFEDDNDLIVGPGKWNNMRNLPGANKSDWGDEIDSLKVGSKATVTVWEDEEFKDNSQTYGPGTEKTNLRGNPDMGDQIDSMEIKCS